MKASELIKLLESNRWYFVRQTGSHKIFKHIEHDDILSVPDHGRKDIPIGTLHSILKKAKIKTK
jgi:predicted RNA binding protein YcfA (HicA-like mRNA interferase family)